MKKKLLILLLLLSPVFAISQDVPGKRGRFDTLKAFTTSYGGIDTMWAVSRMRFTRLTRFDSSASFLQNITITGTTTGSQRSTFPSVAVDTIQKNANSVDAVYLHTPNTILYDSTKTAQFSVPSALIWYSKKFSDTAIYFIGNSFSSDNGRGRFGIVKMFGLSSGFPIGDGRFINYVLFDSANNMRINNSKSSSLSYGDFFIDNGKFTVSAGNARIDSMLTVRNGGVFYRTASSYDTNYAPVTSYTHNAPAFVKSLSMSHDYYSFVGVSEDAILGLFSKDEGGHGSTIDLGEVGTTSGEIVNKWTIGRLSTTGGASALVFNFGKNKDYTVNRTAFFFDTLGAFYLNRNAGVATGLYGIYSKGGLQRMFMDSLGGITLSNETAAGAWAMSFDTYSSSQSPVVLGRRARGTQASPTAISSGDILLFLSGRGYTSGGAFGVNNTGVIAINANEAWSGSAQGTNISLATTQNGTTSRAVDLILDKVNSGTRATFGSTAGTGTGNVYMDSLYIGTTLAIDASRNATLGTGSFSGKVQTGGLTSAGAFGVANIVDTVIYSAVASSIASKNLTATAGTYRLSYNLFTRTAGTGGTAQMTLSFNNGNAQTMTSAAINLNSANSMDDDVFIYTVASGTPTVLVTVTGATGSPTYTFRATVEKLQ